MIPLWAKLLVIGAIAAGLAGWGYAGGLASKQKDWDAAKALQVAAQLQATEQARATEQALQAKVTEANNALTKERAKHARVAADLKRDADGLRNDIARFASGSAEESAAACRQRAQTLGGVLDGVLSDLRTCAIDAESTAADLRAVIAAWPE